jgi:catechol 2,3-dioxygenase-like lactoylglutathione lyase family enzyme
MTARELPARLNFITLACRDMERMTRFYLQFGWPEAPSSEQAHVVALALHGAAHYEPELGPVTDAFRAFTLCVNCHDMDEVAAIYEARAYQDVHELDPPRRAAWGGGFSFRDPEGNVWEVAWAEGSRFDDRGGLTFP